MTLPDYLLERIRSDYMGRLTERVSVLRLSDSVNYMGAPNTSEFVPVRGLDSVPCRFIQTDSEVSSDEGMDLNLDTVQVLFPHNVKRLEVDDLLICGERQFRIIGVLDKETDKIGISAIAKYVRE